MGAGRTGALLIFAALGSGALGFVLGRFTAPEAAPARPAASRPQPGRDYFAGWEREEDEIDGDLAAEAGEEGGEPARQHPIAPAAQVPADPDELVAALRRHAGGPKGQQIVLGLVAQAATRGSEMLPEIRAMLQQGVDVKLAYDGKTGYPSLRVALLAAAEATGDPDAAATIAEVTRTTESPVEVMFGAHLLDRLESLDPESARRVIDSLAHPLPPDQRKAIGTVAQKVVPAASRVDPVYAENFLAEQIRIAEGPRGDPRLLVPVLDGLPEERARHFVLSAITAPDVPERAKGHIASRAAYRSGVEVLRDIRGAIESNILSPRVAGRVARSSVYSSRFRSLERQARRDLRRGDYRSAQARMQAFQTRLAEAQRTVAAARGAGARVPAEMDKRASIHRERMNRLLAQIRRAARKARKENARG